MRFLLIRNHIINLAKVRCFEQRGDDVEVHYSNGRTWLIEGANLEDILSYLRQNKVSL